MSPLTVSRAIAELGRDGVLVSRPGAGTFVAQPRAVRQGDPPDYSWQTVTLAERVIDAEGLSPLADPPHAEGVISLAAGDLHSSLMPLPGPAVRADPGSSPSGRMGAAAGRGAARAPVMVRPAGRLRRR